MKTYKLVTTCILSEYHVGLIAGIILSIAGNCTAYARSTYGLSGLSANGRNMFIFEADVETRKKVKETIDAHFNDAYAIVENGNVVI